MAKETEQRFLVRSDEWRKQAGPGVHLRQGYLSTDAQRNVRIRLNHEEARLTIKGKAKGLTRPEFEYPIPLHDGEQLEHLCLKPVLEKTRYTLEHGALTWEIDEYEGQNRGLIIAEIETDSKLRKTPSWVGPEISADDRYRNYNLVEHPFITWGQDLQKPDSAFYLKSGETLPDGFRRILKEQLNSAIAELSNPQEPLDPSVHEARKCVKRARSALRLIRPAIDAHFDKENRQLQQVGRQLSELRDAQALIEALASLEEEQTRDKPDAKQEFKRAHGSLITRKQKLTAPSHIRRLLRNAVRTLQASSENLDRLSLAALDFPSVVQSFQTSFRRGRKAFSQAYRDPRTEKFHQFRKRAKDLRYQLALFSELWPGVFESYSESAKDLEQYLGEDHNLAVLSGVLKSSSPVLQKLIGKQQSKLREKARPLSARLYSEKPKTWTARLETSWGAWRLEAR